MINKNEVKKIASLSQLSLPEGNELEQLQRSLNDILNLVQELSAVDTQDTLPLAHPIKMQQRLREDMVTEKNNRETFQKLAQHTSEGFYLVPRIIK